MTARKVAPPSSADVDPMAELPIPTPDELYAMRHQHERMPVPVMTAEQLCSAVRHQFAHFVTETSMLHDLRVRWRWYGLPDGHDTFPPGKDGHNFRLAFREAAPGITETAQTRLAREFAASGWTLTFLPVPHNHENHDLAFDVVVIDVIWFEATQAEAGKDNDA